jgi:hypothetical protein
MENPYPNPLSERSGVLNELLDSLNSEELQQYISHFQWRQAHEVFSEKPRSMYQSKAYFLLRTNQFVYDAKLVLARKSTKVLD